MVISEPQDMPLPEGTVAVVLPTLNEKENIGEVIRRIRALGQGIHIVVADDDSRDGTAEIVREWAARDPRVHLLLRRQDPGRGRAGIEGFVFALRLGADFVLEMDADLSHHPGYIPSLLHAARDSDVVIGSRMIRGGGETGRSLLRREITRFSCAYARWMLGVPVRDMNSGFRCFRQEILRKIPWDRCLSVGPSIVQELNIRCFLLGAQFAEVPILFQDRQEGRSKLNVSRLVQGMVMVWKLRRLARRHTL